MVHVMSSTKIPHLDPAKINNMNQGGNSYKCIWTLTTISFKQIHIFLG